MDTPRYRIGNDITIFWAINNRDGSPYDLDGKEVRLFVTNDRGREEVEVEITKLSDSIRNNVLKWDFKGDDQRILGKYTLTLVVLETETHRELTKDYAEAFTLVSRSEMENEEGDANISTGGDLILASKLDIYRIQATNVDVAGLKNQIYDVEKGLITKVEKQEFYEKTGKFDNAFVKIEASIKGINTEIKDASGEMTQIKQTIDGIEVSVGDLEYKVESLEKQTDGAIEKWFYPGVPGPDQLPESNWKTDQDKYSHLGDLYYDENTGIAYRYITKDNQYLWVIIEDADIIVALEAAKNSNRTFIDQPKTPYKVGDLWIAEKDYEETGIKQDDIVVCIITREEGQFDINDWQKKGNAINDEDLEDFVDRYYEDVILPEISKQADKQARAYYGPDDPSLEWEEGTESEHIGDLWYDTNSNKAYYWSGTAWVESDVPEEVFDKIDGKNSIFVSKPEGVAYKENDLWFTEQDYDLEGFRHHKGEILVALEDAVYDAENETYIFSYADWAKRDTYTDDTAVKDLDDYIRTGFKDGVLTESEKQSISSAWDSIVLAQDQLTQDYLTVILPGFTLPEFDELQKAYKAVYNEESTDEYPDLGTFQILEQKVNDVLAYEPTYEPTVDEQAIAALIDAYDEAYDAYRMALSNYTTAYAEFVNAVRAELGQANEYIEAIIDDGKLTPIEKKQLLEVYKGIAVEYDSNVDTAFTAKIWKFDEEGNEVPGAYAGPKGEGQDYFDVYIAYKAAYSPILAVFTGTDWGFDKMDETTVFDGDVDLSTLKDYLDTYYEALRSIAHVISVVAEEKAEASLAMKKYMDDLEEVLTPTESITQLGKGVVLSSVIGVGTYDEESGKYLLKAGMNATAKETEDLVTMSIEHGRIVFVGGVDGKTDWNEATFVVYEDGYVHFRAGKIDKNVQIGEAVLQAVIADEINLLSYPEYDEETGETKLTPLFQVNTRADASGKKKIVSVSSVYDFYINGNLIVKGDTSSTAKGTDAGVAGTLLGIVFNGTKYDEPVNGILTIPNSYYTTEQVDNLIAGVDVSSQLAGYQPLITASNKLDYSLLANTPTIPTNNNQLVNGAGYITGITQSMVAEAIGVSGNAGKVLFSTGGDLGWISLPTSLPASDVYAWAKASTKPSYTTTEVTEGTNLYFTNARAISACDGTYLPLSGGTISGSLKIDSSSKSDKPLSIRSNATDANGACRIAFYDSSNTFQGYVMTGWGNLTLSHRSYNQIGVGTSGIWCSSDNGATKNTLIHSGNIGSYALKVNPSNISIDADTNVAGYGQTADGWPVAGPALLLSNSVGNYAMMLSGRNGVLRFNTREAGNLTGWKTIASTDSNVASATKLATARTIWGQSFDGTGDVSGTLSLGTYSIEGVQGNAFSAPSYVHIGYETSAKGNDTYIDGNNIYLRYGTSHATAMTINSSGNIGIGTTSPISRLHVHTTLTANTRPALGSLKGEIFTVGYAPYFGMHLWSENTGNGLIQVGRSDGTATAYNLILQPLGGNVLIGTTTDSGYKLDVSGDIRSSQYVRANFALITEGNYGIWKGSFFTSARTNNDLVYNAVTHDFRGAVTMASTLTINTNTYLQGGSNNPYLRLTYDNAYWYVQAYTTKGVAGVFLGATSARSLKVDVIGNVSIPGNLVVAGDTSSGSDIRFKDKLSDHRIALSDIAEAPLFTFKWNDREDNTIHLGSSAQYWEKVTPWLVRGEDFKTLDYSTLGVAIGISLANKTLNHEERIKILEDKVKALEAKNRRLRHGS